MLRNEAYIGIRYFNKVKRVREHANPLHGIKFSSSKLVKRDRKNWIGIKVPAIIPQEMFDKVQERMKWNRDHYRNPRKVELLTSLVRCGSCDGSFFCYRRYYIDKRMKNPDVKHKIAYKCNRRWQMLMHTKHNPYVRKCHNKEIKAEILENRVIYMIENVMLHPSKLRESMGFFDHETQAAQLKMEKKLKEIDKNIEKFSVAKKRVIDMYAFNEMDRPTYAKKNLDIDSKISELQLERKELINRIPLLHKKEVIDVNIEQYCKSAKIRFEKCKSFETKRQFMIDYIGKVVYLNDDIELHGSVPVKLEEYNDPNQNSELAKIDFCIKDRIPKTDRLGRKNRKPNHEEMISKLGYERRTTSKKIK